MNFIFNMRRKRTFNKSLKRSSKTRKCVGDRRRKYFGLPSRTISLFTLKTFKQIIRLLCVCHSDLSELFLVPVDHNYTSDFMFLLF